PLVITLTHASYESMVRTFRLPFRAIESTSVVGPFFWSSIDQDDEDPHLRTSASHFLLTFIPPTPKTKPPVVQKSSSANPTSAKKARPVAGKPCSPTLFQRESPRAS